LRDLRGETWQKLVDHISSKDATPIEQSAFILTVVRVSGCVGCNADSFRAMRGCIQCARQSIKRHRGSDEDLLHLYQQAIKECETFDRQHGEK